MSRFFTGALSAVAALMTAALPAHAAQQDSMVARATYSIQNGRTVIEPDSLDRAAFSNVAELLQARVPGLSVTRRGEGSTRVHLRGPTSAFAENSPLLIVDGVRIALERTRQQEFEGRPGPLDDIDVEQVERIEVLSGPAAAGLYGTGAANGVIRISTRDARATPTLWKVFAAAGGLDEGKSYPAIFTRPGSLSSGGVTNTCTRRLEAMGSCTPTGPVASSNPFEEQGIVSSASLMRVGGFAASGSDLLAWSGGATFEREGSVIDSPPRQRVHARGAARARLFGGGELALRAHWMDGSSSLITPGVASLREQGLIRVGLPNWWPEIIPVPEPERDASRRGLVLSAEWRAASWLRGSIVSGLDYSTAVDSYEHTASAGDGITYTTGEYLRQRRHDFTGRADIEAEYGLGKLLRARTTALIDLNEHRRAEWYALGSTSSAGGLGLRMYRRFDQDVAGLALAQEVSIGDRAALRGGLRHEDLHIYSKRWKTPWYPHVSFEWMAMRPGTGLISDVRLHTAYGKAGAVPTLDQLSIFPWEEPVEPKVEVSAEKEAGLHAGFLGQRADVSVSWYSKRTSDVLLQHYGRAGLGDVLNRGIESSLRLALLDGARAAWHLRLGYAHNHNEVTGALAPMILPSRQQVVQGRPLAGYARFGVTSAVDLDGDGVLETVCYAWEARTCEVRFVNEAALYPAFPPTEISAENAFRIGPLTLAVLVDHRRGHYLENVTEALRCRFGLCPEAYATTPSPEGAIRQASVDHGNELYSGMFVEDATFTKLREVSVRLNAPAAWARRLGARRLELSLAGRNLATWTDYTGMDPEASSYDDNGVLVGDLAGAPVPRSITLRLTLTQ